MTALLSSRRAVLASMLLGCGPTAETGDDASGTETSTPTACAWGHTPWIVDLDRREASGVSAWSGGLILGTAISDGDVLSVDPSGAIVWTHDFEPTAYHVNVTEVLATSDGGAIVAAQVFADSQYSFVVSQLSPTGDAGWRVDLGAITNNAWARAEIVATDDGYLVMWDDLGGVAIARLDASTGAPAWTMSEPTNAPLESWLAHALDVLPDGNPVQLMRSDETMRLVQRDAADGSIVSEAVIASVDGFSADLTVLPDGTIFAIVNNLDEGPRLLEVDLDGEVIATHTFEGGDDEYFEVLEWDDSSQALYLGGTAREPGGTQRPWRVVLDRDGVELFNERAAEPDNITSALTVAVLPDGGFAESRFPALHVYAVRCVEE